MSSASPTPSKTPPPQLDDWLSAAVDGDAEALDRACRALRDGDEAAGRRTRDDWHAYHLIGDVLRSSDLASSPEHDANFLAGFRERLAHEPVVVAPAAAPVALPRAGRWRVPVAAVASMAGVAVVAGVLVMSRSGGEGAGGVPLAAAPTVQPQGVPAGSPTLGRDGYLRDARLEEFMRAHQGAAGGLTLVPQGVRQVDLIVTPAPQR